MARPRDIQAAQPAVNAAQVVMLLIGIVLVGIGAVGLSRGGFDELNLQWPFPRSNHGQVISRLKADGAKVIA